MNDNPAMKDFVRKHYPSSQEIYDMANGPIKDKSVQWSRFDAVAFTAVVMFLGGYVFRMFLGG